MKRALAVAATMLAAGFASPLGAQEAGKVPGPRIPRPEGPKKLSAERVRDSATKVPRPPYVAPRTETEQVVARIIGEVLRVEKVGLKDSIRLLGGHSLNDAQVALRIGDHFGVQVSPALIYEYPTVGELSAAVEQLR